MKAWFKHYWPLFLGLAMLFSGILLDSLIMPAPAFKPLSPVTCDASYVGPMVKDCEFTAPCEWVHIDSYQNRVKRKLGVLNAHIRTLNRKG